VTASPEARASAFAAAAPFEHAFYVGMALALVVLVAAGFAPTFFARSLTEAGPLPLLIVLHGVFGTAWVLLFAAQTSLVAARRIAWHRRLGWVAAAVAIAFVASGVVVIAALERSHGEEALAWRAPHVFTNGAPLCAFALLVLAGVWQRASAARHKRLMLLAAVVLLPPAIGRLFATIGIAELNLAAYAGFAFANALYDWRAHGRAHAVSLLGGATLVAIDAATMTWLASVGS
jgi:MFS family permease